MQAIRVIPRALVVAVVGFLTVGCDSLFTANYFSAFDGPASASELTGLTGEALLDGLADAATSPRFFEELSDADRDSLRDSLESTLTSGTATEKQAAALLVADLSLKGTDAGDVTNNIVSVLLDSDGGGFTDPAALMGSIIPAGASETEIAAILDDLVAAATAFEALGGTLAADGGGAPDGANMTEIAQNAVIAVVVSNLVGQTTSADLAAALASDNPETALAGLSLSDPITGSLDEGDPLANIVAAGGLEALLSGL